MTASTILATGLTSVGQLQLVGHMYLHVFSLYLCLCMSLHLFVFAFVSEEVGARVSDGRSVRGRTGWLTQTICSQTAPTHRFTPTFGGKSGANGFLRGKVTLPFLADGLGNWNSHGMKLIKPEHLS